jgi:hypothetical protein
MNNNVYINIDVDLELFARLQKVAGAAGGAAVQSVLVQALERVPEPATADSDRRAAAQ